MRRQLASLVAILSIAFAGLGAPIASAQTTAVVDEPPQNVKDVENPTDIPVCTIQGTSATEFLIGTPKNDVICTGGGDDVVNAVEGDDVVFVQDGGAVTIYGGRGDDFIIATLATRAIIKGGTGTTLIAGSPGDDEITTEEEIDIIASGSGDDIINSGGGIDFISGGSGNDTINGGAGENFLYGLEGDDVITSGGDSDFISGGTGNDTINGGDGDNYLYGFDGNDLITCGEGSSSLYGDSGNDRLEVLGSGRNKLFGDDGDDVLVSGTGYFVGVGGDGNDVIDATKATQGSKLTGERGSDILRGGPGKDDIYGGASIFKDAEPDTMYGNQGDDYFRGANGDDFIFGGEGNDLIRGEGGNDSLFGEDGNDELDGSTGEDILIGGNGNDTIDGSFGLDIIEGNDGNDAILGKAGNDTINGGLGDDTLDGGDGDDILQGGAGDDRLDGGAGSDTLEGGEGTDLCNFDLGESQDGLCSIDGDTPLYTLTRDKDSLDMGLSEVAYITVTLSTPDISKFNQIRYQCGVAGYLNLDFEKKLISHGYPAGETEELKIIPNATSIELDFRMAIPRNDVSLPRECHSTSTNIYNQQIVRQESELVIYQIFTNQPAVPLNLKFKPINSTSGSLSWDIPKTLGTPSMSSYTVQYSVDKVNWITTSVPDIRKTNVQINDLPQNSNLTFRVRGNNVLVATSIYQSFTWATTSGSTPSANNALNPTKLNVSNITSTGLKLNWVPPVGESGFNLTGYSAEISSDGTNWTALPVGSSRAKTLSAKGLRAGTNYQIRLAAVSGISTGGYSYISARTVATVPGPPANLLAFPKPTSKANLTWTTPEITGGEVITGYKVELSTDKGKTWQYQYKAKWPRLYFYIGRTPKKTYYYRVTAINKVGTGTPSPIAKFTTN